MIIPRNDILIEKTLQFLDSIDTDRLDDLEYKKEVSEKCVPYASLWEEEVRFAGSLRPLLVRLINRAEIGIISSYMKYTQQDKEDQLFLAAIEELTLRRTSFSCRWKNRLHRRFGWFEQWADKQKLQSEKKYPALKDNQP